MEVAAAAAASGGGLCRSCSAACSASTASSVLRRSGAMAAPCPVWSRSRGAHGSSREITAGSYGDGARVRGPTWSSCRWPRRTTAREEEARTCLGGGRKRRCPESWTGKQRAVVRSGGGTHLERGTQSLQCQVGHLVRVRAAAGSVDQREADAAHARRHLRTPQGRRASSIPIERERCAGRAVPAGWRGGRACSRTASRAAGSWRSLSTMVSVPGYRQVLGSRLGLGLVFG